VFSVATLGMGLLGFILAIAVAGPRVIGSIRKRVQG